jgi:hypothetical protein
MMGVDDVGSSERGEQPGRERVRRVAAQVKQGAQRAAPQATRLDLDSGMAAKGQQLTLDVRRQGAGELEWVAFAAAE